MMRVEYVVKWVGMECGCLMGFRVKSEGDEVPPRGTKLCRYCEALVNYHLEMERKLIALNEQAVRLLGRRKRYVKRRLIDLDKQIERFIREISRACLESSTGTDQLSFGPRFEAPMQVNYSIKQ